MCTRWRVDKNHSERCGAGHEIGSRRGRVGPVECGWALVLVSASAVTLVALRCVRRDACEGHSAELASSHGSSSSVIPTSAALAPPQPRVSTE
jgi:hypothetical protein